jgi:lipase
MQPMREPELLDVPVDGGTLRAVRWGTRGPLVLAAHGVTASWISWAAVAAEIGDDLVLVAPDLRGRGESSTLPPPYGIGQHAKDCVAILDHLGVETCVAAGHSMGGWVAAAFANLVPERVTAAVLSDGGFKLFDRPPGGTVEEILGAVIGPSLARLRMTFRTREAYLDYWRVHPSFADPSAWNEDIEAYFLYDLTGDEPELRSRVSLEAVLADATDQLTVPAMMSPGEAVTCPVTWIRAERGLLNETPLYSDERVAEVLGRMPHMQDILVRGVNHYTLVMRDPGATIVAEQIRKAAGVP